jgi:hypothetical protein
MRPTPVTSQVLVNEWSTRLHRLKRIKDRGELFVIDLYQFEGFFGNIRVGGGNTCDGIPNIPSLVEAVAGLILDAGSVPCHQILACDNDFHSQNPLGPACIDIKNLRMRERTPQYFSVKHSSELEIGSIKSLSRNLLNGVDPRNTGSNKFSFFHRCCHEISASKEIYSFLYPPR